MKAGQVNQAWYEHLQRERSAGRGVQTTRAQLSARAVTAIRQHMPELVDERGHPCSVAVQAYVELHMSGETPVTPAKVRARRDHLMPSWMRADENARRRSRQGMQLQLEGIAP